MQTKVGRWVVLSWMVAACASPTLPAHDADLASDVGEAAGADAASADDGPAPDGLVSDGGAADAGTIEPDDGAAVANSQADVPGADAQIDTASACPTAVVTVLEGSTVVPGTMLHLNGGKSVAADGSAVTKYNWSVKQPYGSAQVFIPMASFSHPSFTTKLAGGYEFCLSVWDSTNTKSCQPACVKVSVIPDEAVHVELTWTTPGGSGPGTSAPGVAADLDLHFAHPLAVGDDLDCDGLPDPWFSAMFDCFWFNQTPKWGPVGSAVGKPSLNVGPGGPETLRLAQPEGTLASPASYEIGVHFWDDHGLGPSIPTVRVYMLGVLVMSIKGPQMKMLDIWHVGTLHWPNGLSSSGSKSDPVTLCFQTGQPCNKSDPGKKWTATGGHCLHPCYIKKSFATALGAKLGNCKMP